VQLFTNEIPSKPQLLYLKVISPLSFGPKSNNDTLIPFGNWQAKKLV